MAQKYEKLIFGQTLSTYISACQDLPMDFYCLSESLTLYQKLETVFKKIGCFKKILNG